MTLISTHPVKKGDLGFHGNLFGGKLLAWCDAAGAALAWKKYLELDPNPDPQIKNLLENEINAALGSQLE